jgi:hypothetical protein
MQQESQAASQLEASDRCERFPWRSVNSQQQNKGASGPSYAIGFMDNTWKMKANQK